MDPLVEQVLQQLSKKEVSQIGQQIGADKNTTLTALSTMMPLLVGALAKNASQPEGAQALHKALASDHDGSLLNNISGFLANPAVANGAGILVHILGSQQSVVTQGLTKATGLSSDQVGQLLQIAAPLVMSQLGQQQQQANLDPNGLSNFLGDQHQQAQQSNPDLLGVVNTLLDTNKDGSGLDEVIGLVGKLFASNSTTPKGS
jgi:hypothetical protein